MGHLEKLLSRTPTAAQPMSEQPELDDWIASIRDSDPITFEDAYHGPRPSGAAVVPRLIHELHGSLTGYIRGKFVELLGEMGDQSVVPILIAELAHPDQNVREWAVTALTKLDYPEGLRAVRQYRDAHPEE
jgi:HEAT repeat protein